MFNATIKIKRDGIQFEGGEADSHDRAMEWSSKLTTLLWDAGYGPESAGEITHGKDHAKLDIGARVIGCWFWPEKNNGIPKPGTAVCHEPDFDRAIEDNEEELIAAYGNLEVARANILNIAELALSDAIVAEEKAWESVPA